MEKLSNINKKILLILFSILFLNISFFCTEVRAENIYMIPTRTLKEGNSGDDVKWVQYQLNCYAKYNLNVDGDFGKLTTKAVKNFQKKNNLKPDGIVGKDTRNTLKKVKVSKPSYKHSKTFKFTYYTPKDNDGYSKTSSGLTIKNFKIDPTLGCYTFNGKVVLAGASKPVARSEGYSIKSYIHYFDPSKRTSVKFKFKNKTYQGIIIDGCGASCRVKKGNYQILDVFFPNESAAKKSKINQAKITVYY